MKPRRQLNRYTQRELEVIMGALVDYNNLPNGSLPDAWEGAVTKTRLRLRKEKNRAK